MAAVVRGSAGARLRKSRRFRGEMPYNGNLVLSQPINLGSAQHGSTGLAYDRAAFGTVACNQSK